MLKKKRVFIFTDFFNPGYKAGGPITTIENLTSSLNDIIDFIIVTRNYDLGEKHLPYLGITNHKWYTLNNIAIMYLSDSEITIKNINNIIREKSPDVIYLNSFFSKFTIYVLWLTLNDKALKNKIILAPRGELHSNALAYKKIKKKFFFLYISFFRLYTNLTWHASTEFEKKNIIDTRIKSKTIYVLNNFVKFDNVKRDKNYTKDKSSLRIVFISRIHRTKNLRFALELLLSLKGKILFDIYGLLEDENYWKECETIIKSLPLNITVKYKGALLKADVTKTMVQYDLLLFPTMNENFGQVIFEALSVGLPVIISDRTPWIALESNKAGYDIPLDNVEKFIQSLNFFTELEDSEMYNWFEGAKTFAHKMINLDELKHDYIKMFDSIAHNH